MSGHRRRTAGKPAGKRFCPFPSQSAAVGPYTTRFMATANNIDHPHFVYSRNDNPDLVTQFTLHGPRGREMSCSGIIGSFVAMDDLGPKNKCHHQGICYLENLMMWIGTDLMHNSSMYLSEVVTEEHFRFFMDFDFKVVPGYRTRCSSSLQLPSQSVGRMAADSVRQQTPRPGVKTSVSSSEESEGSYVEGSLEENHEHHTTPDGNVIKFPEELKIIMLMSIHRSLGRLYELDKLCLPNPQDWKDIHDHHKKHNEDQQWYEQQEAYFPRCPAIVEHVRSYWQRRVDKVKAELSKLRCVQDAASKEEALRVMKLASQLEELRQVRDAEVESACEGMQCSDDDFRLGNMIVTTTPGRLVVDTKKGSRYHKFGMHLHCKNLVVNREVMALVRAAVVSDLNNNSVLNSLLADLGLQWYGGKWNWANIVDEDVYKSGGTNLRLVGSKKYDERMDGSLNPCITAAYLPESVLRYNGVFDKESVMRYLSTPPLMVMDCSIRTCRRQRWWDEVTPWKFETEYLREHPDVEMVYNSVRRQYMQEKMGLSDDEMNELIHTGGVRQKRVRQRMGQDDTTNLLANIRPYLHRSQQVRMSDHDMQAFMRDFISKIHIGKQEIDQFITTRKKQMERMHSHSSEMLQMIQRQQTMYRVYSMVCENFRTGRNTVRVIYKTNTGNYTLFTDCRTCPNNGADHSSKTIFFTVSKRRQVFLKCTCKCVDKIGLTGSPCSEFMLPICYLDNRTYAHISSPHDIVNLQNADRAQLHLLQLRNALPERVSQEEMEYEEYLENEKKKKRRNPLARQFK